MLVNPADSKNEPMYQLGLVITPLSVRLRCQDLLGQLETFPPVPASQDPDLLSATQKRIQHYLSSIEAEKNRHYCSLVRNAFHPIIFTSAGTHQLPLKKYLLLSKIPWIRMYRSL